MIAIQKNGFTLIVVLVSVALFSIIMVVALGSLVALSSAVRRAEALDTATNNISAALDSVSRAVRTGNTYHCGPGGDLTSPLDCASASSFTFLDSDTPPSRVTYCLSSSGTLTCNTSTSCGSGSCTVLRSKNGGPFIPLTAPEVNVTHLTFITTGAPAGDGLQPKVTILLVGTITISAASSRKINLYSRT